MRRSRAYTRKEINEIKGLLKKAKTVSEFKRIQSIWLKMCLDLSAQEIAKATDLSENSVHCYQSRLRKRGKEAIKGKERGGRRRENLSIEEEKEVLREFSKRGKRGDLLVVSEVQKAYEAKLGRVVAKSTVYRMLSRHGWRKIVPRRRHPKADAERQKAFKKT